MITFILPKKNRFPLKLLATQEPKWLSILSLLLTPFVKKLEYLLQTLLRVIYETPIAISGF